MSQDRPLERLQVAARLETQFLDHQPPPLAEDGERVCLAAAAVQRQHQLAAQLLAQRLLFYKHEQLAHELLVQAELELRVDPAAEGIQAKLRQARPRRLGKGLALELGERLASPEPKRLSQQRGAALRVFLEARGFGQFLEPGQIGRFSAQAVARRASLDCLPAERLPQRRDVRLQDLRSAGRRLIPQGLDQGAARDDSIRVQQ